MLGGLDLLIIKPESKKESESLQSLERRGRQRASAGQGCDEVILHPITIPSPAAGALPLYPFFPASSKRGETMPYSVQPRKVAMAPHIIASSPEL